MFCDWKKPGSQKAQRRKESGAGSNLGRVFSVMACRFNFSRKPGEFGAQSDSLRYIGFGASGAAVSAEKAEPTDCRYSASKTYLLSARYADAGQ
jgi:hypothetical protein